MDSEARYRFSREVVRQRASYFYSSHLGLQVLRHDVSVHETPET